ncbi:unnamed protein product [Closterium sp. NIES-64]|nr:unnamed protein product [Closterium sp. NIES-64]
MDERATKHKETGEGVASQQQENAAEERLWKGKEVEREGGEGMDGASASELASFNARLRDWGARVKAALAAAQKRILRTEGEVTKKRKAEECQRKAEEVKRNKAEGARRKREEAKKAAEMREERERAREEEKRVKKEEKRKENERRKEEETRQKEEKRKENERRKEEETRQKEEKRKENEREVRKEEEKRRAQEKERERAKKEEAAFDEQMEQLEEEWQRRQADAPMTYEEYSSSLTQLRKQAARAGVGSSRIPGTTPLHFWDIPWPPAGNCLFLSPGDPPGLKRRKAMDALLFWHPDKFLNYYGGRLVAGHREAVLKKVAGLSREVVVAAQRVRG